MALPIKKYLARAVRAPNGCLCWQGYLSKPDGYARVFRDGKVQNLSRVIWEDANGPIPEGLMILHSCDDPSCIELSHLSPGTHAQNQDEKARRRRAIKKLSDDHVVAIRGDQAVYRDIADRYGISPAMVCLIKQGKARIYAGE